MFTTNFLSTEQAKVLTAKHGTPLYVYSKKVLEAQADAMLAVPAPYGLTVRYAMKANHHPEILETFRRKGIHIDASSGYEVEIALKAGFKPSEILLTSQQLAHNLKEQVGQGVQFTATSLKQLEAYGQLFPGTEVGVRVNPGIGSGHSAKTNVGGVTSSFGIWHEYIPQIDEIAVRNNLRITRLHTHIGSGTHPEVWQQALKISLELAKEFPQATTLDMGGGFKVARTEAEHGVDMKVVGKLLADELHRFNKETGRTPHLELEPGTFLTANAGILLAEVEDIVDTGEDGYTFIKLNTGMNDFMRPVLYAAQHPIAVLNDSDETKEYVVVGHNCESGDLLTPTPDDSGKLGPRTLAKAELGDLVLIGGTGAYSAGLRAHGFNGFPSAQEVFI